MTHIIYINHHRYGIIPVASVTGDVMYKEIRSESWLMQKPPGIAFDDSSLKDAKRLGAKFVCATYKGIQYWSDIDLIRIPVDRCYNVQFGLGWKDWRATRIGAEQHASMKRELMKQKAPMIPVQEDFFGKMVDETG